MIEYSNNYPDTSGSLWLFKRVESSVTAAGNIDNVTTNNWSSFKYKLSILGKLVAIDNGVLKKAKIAVPLKYRSSFWGLLEIPLNNCKIHLELNWTKNCVMSGIAGNIEFKISNTKLYIPIVTLSTEDNVKLTKQSAEWFKRSVIRVSTKWKGSQGISIKPIL